MNTNTHTYEHHRQQPTHFGGNSITESESLIDLLFETYLEAGLQRIEAWDAALADYAHGFAA